MQANDILNALQNRSRAVNGGPLFQSGQASGQPASAGLDANQSVGAMSFDKLLEEARTGAAKGLSPVKIGKGVNIELTTDQLERIAAAADLAEANGADRAIVLVDGRALQVDITSRTIMGEAGGSRTASMPDVDAIVSAPVGADAQADAGSSAILPPPGAAPNQISSPQMAKFLSTVGGA